MSVSHINLIVIEGRLTKDPEARGGGKVASFSLASNRWFYKDDERVEETVFVDVTAFGFEAKSVLSKLSKGSRVTVQGRLELNRWEAEDGSKRQQLRIVANSVTGTAMSGSGQTESRPESGSEGVAAPQPEPVYASGVPSDDDIPF